MHWTLSSDTLLEKVALTAKQVPVPVVQALHFPMLAQALITSVRLGLYEHLAPAPLRVAELAQKSGLTERGLARLLPVLEALGYLESKDGRFGLTATSRKWFLASSEDSLVQSLAFSADEWNIAMGLERFLKEGRAPDYLSGLGPEGWARSQGAARERAAQVAPLLWRLIPSLKEARTLLDLGGGPGHHAAALLEKWPQLEATVIDLPEALAATPAVSPKLKRLPGDVRTVELGAAQWNVILLSLVVHHLPSPECTALFARVAKALTPGGLVIVHEWNCAQEDERSSQVDAAGDLFFSLVSPEGPYTLEKLEGFTRAAGLETVKSSTLPGVRTLGLLVAKKR